MEPQQPAATPSQPPVPPTPPPSQSSSVKNSLLVIMSVLLLVAVSLAGFFFWQMQRLSKQLAQYQTQPTPSPTALIQPTPDETANWKTYTYQIFTIKFPLDWSTTSSKNPIQFLNYTPDPKSGGEFNPSTDKRKLKVEIYQKSTSDSLESYLAQQKSSAIEARGNEINWQETKTVVAGKEAIRVKTAIPGFTYNFKDVSSNTIFSIAFELDFDNYKELSDQILSTFKFLETPSPTP